MNVRSLRLAPQNRKRIAIGLAFALAIALTTVVNLSLISDATAHPESTETTVRISAFKAETGAVRVALQQQDANGAWGERRHPQLNTVQPEATTGFWLSSSPLQIGPTAVQDGPLFCIASHGGREDFFRRLVRGYARQAAIDAGINVRFTSSLEGAQQAAAIDQCSADGAAVIAATLADPDAVRASLIAAKQAGSRIVTFNSGAEEAASVGSELHIALDETAAGRLVGQEFTNRGISGTIGCLLHEEDNVGLGARCDALAASYSGGATLRIRLPEDGSADEIAQVVAERLVDPDQPPMVAVVALNGDTLLAALNGIIATADQVEGDVQIAGIGQNADLRLVALEHRRRHLAFVTNNAAEAQGYLITAALQMVNGYTIPGDFVSNPTVLTATPFIYDLGAFWRNREAVSRSFQLLQRRLALGEEFDE